MPKPSQSGFKRFFYNQNIKRDKSSNKYKNLLNHIVLLLKKTEKEGVTNWVSNAFAKAQLKVTSYGISFRQVFAVLEHKGITHFEEVVHQHLFFVQKKGSVKSVLSSTTPKKTTTDSTEKKSVDKKVVAKKIVESVVEKKVKKPSVKKTDV